MQLEFQDREKSASCKICSWTKASIEDVKKCDFVEVLLDTVVMSASWLLNVVAGW